MKVTSIVYGIPGDLDGTVEIACRGESVAVFAHTRGQHINGQLPIAALEVLHRALSVYLHENGSPNLNQRIPPVG